MISFLQYSRESSGVDLKTLSDEAIGKFIEINESDTNRQPWLEAY